MDTLTNTNIKTKNDKPYWRTNMCLTVFLLILWGGVNFGITFFARELNEIHFLGFPLGFYMAAQGSLLLNLLITGIYSFYMNYLDRRYGVPEDRNT